MNSFEKLSPHLNLNRPARQMEMRNLRCRISASFFSIHFWGERVCILLIVSYFQFSKYELRRFMWIDAIEHTRRSEIWIESINEAGWMPAWMTFSHPWQLTFLLLDVVLMIILFISVILDVIVESRFLSKSLWNFRRKKKEICTTTYFAFHRIIDNL